MYAVVKIEGKISVLSQNPTAVDSMPTNEPTKKKMRWLVQIAVCGHTADSNSVESAVSVSMTADKEEDYEEFGTEPF